MRPARLHLTLIGLFTAALIVNVDAKPRPVMVTAPLGRLITNLTALVKQSPNNPKYLYLLGRLHAVAYVTNANLSETLPADDKIIGRELPLINNTSPVESRYAPNSLKPVAEALVHISESVKAYRQSIRLDPTDPLSHMGLAWIMEQGIAHSARLGPPPSPPNVKTKPTDWARLSLASYRRAYRLASEADQKSEPHYSFAKQLTNESGQGILRLTKGMNLNESERGELREIAVNIAIVRQKYPEHITPIVVPLGKETGIQFLTAPHRRVNFDLAVDGRKHKYAWVRPDVAFLVWDPSYAGKIHDGQQLFGNRTWQMFWENGYQPLAALDNNRDGILTGSELAGLSLWTDKNSNGRSDSGEVRSLISLGVQAISVKPQGKIGQTHWQTHGIQMRDGRWLPTYDWIAEG